MSKPKKNIVTYTLNIKYNKDTDEVEYIAEGYDDDMADFVPITPFNIEKDYTEFITSEDMEMIQEIYDIEDC